MAFVAGVADGVGGWRHYGIDPGVFSGFLMQTCERLVTSGSCSPSDPAMLLARSYRELLENKQPIIGETFFLNFACFISHERLCKKKYKIFILDLLISLQEAVLPAW